MGGEVCNSYHVSVLYCFLIEAPLEDHVCNLVSIILLSIVIVVAFTDSTYILHFVSKVSIRYLTGASNMAKLLQLGCFV